MIEEQRDGNGFVTFDVPPNTCTNEDVKFEQKLTYQKGGFLKSDYKGRVILEANQTSTKNNLRSLATLVLGNPEIGDAEFDSFTSTSNVTGQYIAAVLDSRAGGKIEFDVAGNIILDSILEVVVKAKQLTHQLEQFHLTSTKQMSLHALTGVLSAIENLTLSSRLVGINCEKININSTASVGIRSSDILLGSIREQEEGDEENVGDKVMTLRRFNKWWEDVLKPFAEEIERFVEAYNDHIHPIPGGISEAPLPPFILAEDDILSNAQTSEKLKGARTTRAL